MFTVYVLASLSGKGKYTGYTDNITRRLFEHNNGLLGKYTKKKGPWKLIYSKPFGTRSEAMKYEKFLKSGKGRDFLNKVLGS